MKISWQKGFLAVHRQLNRTACLFVCLSLGPAPLTIRSSTTLKSDPRELWPLRHLIRGIRRHDLTQNDLPTYLPTHLPTYLPDHSLSHFWFTVCSRIFSCYQCDILNCVRQCALTIATQDNPADLWHLRNCLQFRQLRTWIHDNLCYLNNQEWQWTTFAIFAMIDNSEPVGGPHSLFDVNDPGKMQNARGRANAKWDKDRV